MDPVHTNGGSIPFKSAIVHPIASLCSFYSSNRLSSWSFCRSKVMMTGRVSLAPRKAYFSLSGKGFNSSFGGDSREGMGGVLDVRGKDSFGIFQGWKFALVVVSSKSRTSSMY
jgi:hypothetical protein